MFSNFFSCKDSASRTQKQIIFDFVEAQPILSKDSASPFLSKEKVCGKSTNIKLITTGGCRLKNYAYICGKY